MNTSWIQIAIIVTSLLIGIGSYFITKKPDGPVEQAAETVLRSQGLDVDLSP